MIYSAKYPNFCYIEKENLPSSAYELEYFAILESVISLFSRYFANVNQYPLFVINNDNTIDYAPQTFYETYTIYLNVLSLGEDNKPTHYWSQLIYQFSHEFCHYMNFGHVPTKLRWFEESICEMASLFFLLKSSELWVINPPVKNSEHYSKSLLNYVLNIYQKDKMYEESFSLSDPAVISQLEKDEYNRDMNRRIAIAMLPLFIENPDLWKCIPHLPELSAKNSFHDNLQLLEKLSNQDLSNILSIFGFN